MTNYNKDDRSYSPSFPTTKSNISLYDMDLEYLPEFSSLPQLDGNDSLDDQSDIIKPPLQSVRTRIANFELNYSKQTAGIIKDAEAKDLNISFKDTNKNINLECSSGFYAEVAKPAIQLMTNEDIPTINGYKILLENTTRNLDAAGFEYNITIFFKIISPTGCSSKLTIHTHKSKRMIQL